MTEQIDYGAAQQAVPGTTYYRVMELELSRRRGLIRVLFEGQNKAEVQAYWRDADGENATGLIKQLNTANLPVKSLERRVIERAVTDGKLPAGGTINGTPDP